MQGIVLSSHSTSEFPWTVEKNLWNDIVRALENLIGAMIMSNLEIEEFQKVTTAGNG